MRRLCFVLLMLLCSPAYATTWVSAKYDLEVTTPDAWAQTDTANGLGFNLDKLFVGVSQVTSEQAKQQLETLTKSGATTKETKIDGRAAVVVQTVPKSESTIRLTLVDLDKEQRLMVMAVGSLDGLKKHEKNVDTILKSLKRKKKSATGMGKGFGDFLPVAKDIKLANSKLQLSLPAVFTVEKTKTGFAAIGDNVVVQYACGLKRDMTKSTFNRKIGKVEVKGAFKLQGDGPAQRQATELYVNPAKNCTLDVTSGGPPSDLSHEIARQILRSVR